eukprot:tig00000144_g9017.t1
MARRPARAPRRTADQSAVPAPSPAAPFAVLAPPEKSYTSDDLYWHGSEPPRTEEECNLPLRYDPDAIARYFRARPAQVASRWRECLVPLLGFAGKLLVDWRTGKWDSNEFKRANELREILTKLGPAFIKVGQALSIRPDIVGPFYMEELQKLCDAVPTFPNEVAFQIIEEDLGMKVDEVFSEITPNPIAAASLGQVYKATLRDTGETVAVKVQRPRVLESVSLDLYLMRQAGLAARKVPFLRDRTDFVSVLDEWAVRFFDELDYVTEAANARRFAELHASLPDVFIPAAMERYTSRRVIVLEWLEGTKLSESSPEDIKRLVNVGVECFLMQLLETGFFHADPHPGNLMKTPDGRLAILDFGLMSEMKSYQMYGMIEAITHLVNGEYEKVTEDFVKLEFLPPGVDISPIIPVLTQVFEVAMRGGGVANINFQELSAQLAEITFKYPFRIPPYFALILRALSVLEGIALTGDPEFQLVLNAYPYIARRLVTDESAELRNALLQVLYRDGRFDFAKFRSLLDAAEGVVDGLDLVEIDAETKARNAREALGFLLSKEGTFLREMVVEEVAQGIDAYSRLLLHRALDPRPDEPAPALPPGLLPASPFLPSPTAAAALLPGPARAAILEAAGGEPRTAAEVQHARNMEEILAWLGESARAMSREERDASLLGLFLVPQLQRLTAQIGARLGGRVSSRFLQTLFSWTEERLS